MRPDAQGYWCSPSSAGAHRGSLWFLVPLIAIECWSGKTRQSQPGAELCQPVFGMAERGGRENCLEATTVVPYRSLGKHDGRGGGNARALLSQKLRLVCAREVAKCRFNKVVKLASGLHLPSHGSEIPSEAFCSSVSGTEDGFCSQIVTLLQGTPAFCEISLPLFFCTR